MNILVVVEQVLSTETQVSFNQRTNQVEFRGEKYDMNLYDEYALEESLRIKENTPSVKITALTLGPQNAESVLRECLAIGADEVVHLNDELFNGLDEYATSTVIAAYAQQRKYDLILCGKRRVDTGSEYIGPALAEALEYQFIGSATDLQVDQKENTVRANQSLDGTTYILKTALPAVVAIEKGLYEPRYPTIKSALIAKKKSIPKIDAKTLGFVKENISNKSVVVKITSPLALKGRAVLESQTQSASDRMKQIMYGLVQGRKASILHEQPEMAAQKLIEWLKVNGFLSQ